MIGLNFSKKKKIKRYSTFFSILIKYSFGYVVARSPLKKLVPKSYIKNNLDTKKFISPSKYERMRIVLEDMGPTYVKLGQIFSNREDLLPPDLKKELTKLQDSVPELKNFDVKKTVNQTLNITIEDYFESIETQPIATAPLAQVHKAKLLTDDFVALKIQRPKITELSTDALICMELVDGIKITEIETLSSLNIETSKVAKMSVNLSLEQLLEHGFFHADPHLGNFFFLQETEQTCFIYFGMIGTILPNDNEAVVLLLQHFLQKDVKKIIPLLEKAAVKTEIPDYKKLEYNLLELIDGTSNTTIKNINLSITLGQIKRVLYENKITLSHYVYMLIRALVVIEAVGLKLDPKFNITDNLKPYMSKIMRKRFSTKHLFKKNVNRFQNMSRLMDSLPDDIDIILKNIKDGKLAVNHEYKDLTESRYTTNKTINRLVFAVIIAALSIGSSLLVTVKMPPLVYGVPLVFLFQHY